MAAITPTNPMAERTCIIPKTEGGVWNVPARGGDEIELSPGIDAVNCAPAKRGLYCLENANDRATVSFLDLKTRSRRVLVVVPGPIINGLAASPDERWLLYTKADFTGSELMLVENFWVNVGIAPLEKDSFCAPENVVVSKSSL